MITGTNRGLGLAFVRSYAADGWRVHACCRNPDKAKALKAVEGEVTILRLDVTDGLRVASLSREMADEPIDLLINNAAVYHPKRGFGETDYTDWQEELKVNTLAPLRMAERFVKQVAASELKQIVNISSRMASIALNEKGGSYVYRSSKAALNMVSRGLAADLAGHGITVIALSPGWVQTDMGSGGADLTPEESVALMRKVVDGLKPADSGRFFNQEGEELPW